MSDRLAGGITMTELITMTVACVALITASWALGLARDLGDEVERLRSGASWRDAGANDALWAALRAEQSERHRGEDAIVVRLFELERAAGERAVTAQTSRPSEYRIIRGLPTAPGFQRTERYDRTLLHPAPQGPGGVGPSEAGTTLVSERGGP